MKLSGQFVSVSSAGKRQIFKALCCAFMGLVIPQMAAATEVITDGNKVIRIENIEIANEFGVTVWDVRFVYGTAFEIYGGPNGFFKEEETAIFEADEIMDALNLAVPRPTRAGPNGTLQFYIPFDIDEDLTASAGGEYFAGAGAWENCGSDCLLGVAVRPSKKPLTYAVLTPADERPPPPPSDSTVDLGGNVYTVQGDEPVPLCAMVLASGKFQFSCSPNGPFELNDLPRENDGSVRRQVYVDGFFPNIDVLPDSTEENVYMEPAGSCPDYNAPYNAGESPGSAGDRVDISGQVLLGSGNTPICAMVLANGEYVFSCDGSGNYSLNIPLDAKGQFQLQVYAEGFAPNIQVFDEFKSVNDVRMARSSECN